VRTGQNWDGARDLTIAIVEVLFSDLQNVVCFHLIRSRAKYADMILSS
jgi:hypothetical protein